MPWNADGTRTRRLNGVLAPAGCCGAPGRMRAVCRSAESTGPVTFFVLSQRTNTGTLAGKMGTGMSWREALERDLHLLVEGSGEAGSQRWRGALQRVDRLRVSNAPTLHPRLRHFLDRRSYAKALAFLEDRENEDG